jgi:phosphomannomutase
MISKYQNRYVVFLKKELKIKKQFSVIFDCSDGTTGPIVKSLFSQHPLVKARFLNSRPNGRFPAHGPDPWKRGATRELKENVKKHKADLGVIFDADGDRVFFVDDKSRIIPPDVVGMLLAHNVKDRVLIDIRMGFLIREYFKKKKIKIFDSRVGHYFIKNTMRKNKIPLGIEMSGHYYFRKFFYADSGIFSSIQVLNSLEKISEPLSSFIDSLPKYFQSGEINFEVGDKEKVMERIKKIFKPKAVKISLIDGIKMEFGNSRGRWWFGVRASNTQNLLRLNIESDNQKLLDQKIKKIAKFFN